MVNAKRCITIENEPNMKPVQICTGFIFFSCPKILTAKQNYHMHFLSHYAASGSDITQFNKIDKPLVVYRSSNTT